ncbi:hypothetical protein BH18CHL2_BH18CHL2_01470 [soil metagenome]
MLEAIAKENEDLERKYGVRLSLRIGVTTGEVLGGAVDETGRTEPAVGRTVDVAQRLESTAIPNTVHIGERTYQAARREFRFRAAPLVTLAGEAGMERAYRLVGRRRQVADTGGPAISVPFFTGLQVMDR